MPQKKDKQDRLAGTGDLEARNPLPGRVQRKARGPAPEKDLRDLGPLALLSQVDLARVLNVSVSTVKKIQQQPGFPHRRQLPGGPKGWLYGEIEQYIKQLPAAPSDDSDDVEE